MNTKRGRRKEGRREGKKRTFLHSRTVYSEQPREEAMRVGISGMDSSKDGAGLGFAERGMQVEMPT